MVSAAQVLGNNGMQNADVIVQAATMEGLEVAIAATLIAAESWGKHIWGADPGPTGGTYVKHAPVTEDAYLRYRDAVHDGRIGRQGCGIAQLTSSEYQDRGDQLGGTWDKIANCRSGFRGLKALIDRYGERDGARRYNGTGSAAERYADSFVVRLRIWRSRLIDSPVVGGSGGDGADSIPRLNEGDTGPAVRHLQEWFNVNFPAYDATPIDLGPQRYGPATVSAVAEFQRRSGITDGDGRNIGPATAKALWEAGYRP